MHRAYRVSIVYFSLFTLLLLTSGAMLFELKISFDIEHAISYYMGNDELFIAVKTNSGILKLVLPHIFAYGLLAMVILHFLNFTKYKNLRAIKVVVYLVFISQFFEIFTPFLVVNISESFIYLKIISFFIFMGLIPFVLYLLVKSINAVKER